MSRGPTGVGRIGGWPARMLVGATLGLVATGCGESDTPTTRDTTSTTTTTTTTAATTTTTESISTTSVPVVVTSPPIAAPDPVPPMPPPGMELVWSDEFDGEAIDPANWTYDIGGWGWGNGEAQYYTDRPTNARVDNGLLVIELHEEQYEDSYYTSARLRSQGLQEFQYGRIEARIKVPSGAGTWPAFWMLGSGFDPDSDDPAQQWPNVGEIDIMEYVGREPDLVIGTIHGPGYAGSSGISQWNRQEFEIGDDFHTFAVDWDADGIRWYFNDELYFDVPRDRVGRREWVFDQPFFMILNLALGGTLGGTIAADLEYPIPYYIDYVRVYQSAADGSEQ